MPFANYLTIAPEVGSGCGTIGGAVVSSQEIRGLSPVIGSFYLLFNGIEKDENKSKRDKE